MRRTLVGLRLEALLEAGACAFLDDGSQARASLPLRPTRRRLPASRPGAPRLALAVPPARPLLHTIATPLPPPPPSPVPARPAGGPPVLAQAQGGGAAQRAAGLAAAAQPDSAAAGPGGAAPGGGWCPRRRRRRAGAGAGPAAAAAAATAGTGPGGGGAARAWGTPGGGRGGRGWRHAGQQPAVRQSGRRHPPDAGGQRGYGKLRGRWRQRAERRLPCPAERAGVTGVCSGAAVVHT